MKSELMEERGPKGWKYLLSFISLHRIDVFAQTFRHEFFKDFAVNAQWMGLSMKRLVKLRFF